MTEPDKWNKIWNNRSFDSNIVYNYNGYNFNSLDEYNIFISEMTKNLIIKNNQKILDIGCGNGSFINSILNNKNIEKYDLTGIDYCYNSIEYANKSYNGNFMIHDIKNKLPFNDNSFDVILCISTLFYLDNEEQLADLINEIKRVSRTDSIIFFGNCMDFSKKSMALELRKKTHSLESNHLYIKKDFIARFFKDKNISITDLDELPINFYSGQKYKFNMLIENLHEINIGIDFHDTLSYNVNFFKVLFNNWKGKIFIITGTPLSKKNEIILQLNNLGFFENIHFDIICFGYEYKKDEMDYTHFEKMKVHKLKAIQDNNIKIYFDDNPYYVNYLKDFNIFVYQPILSSKYINKFKKIDKYFCCNLQENQFNYLNNLSIKKKAYVPGVFDLFHIGHLKLLKKLNEFNFFIIVGVQDDSSVFNSKKKYPVLNINERINFIKELNFVSRVLSYSNTDQSEYLKNLNADIFVIGPEFGNTINHKNTLKFCKDNNIEVLTIERTKDISTTSIVKRIQK
jgi:glycerol-3-phosphate cytidylyltransferase